MKRWILALAAMLGSALGQSLTLWTHFEGAELEFLKRQITIYERLEGFKVQLVEVPFEDLRARLLAADQPPDLVLTIPHDWTGELAAAGLLEPTGRYLTENLAEISNLQPITLDSFRYQGRVYGLPMIAETTALIYNKKLVPTPPATWEEFLRVAQAQTRGNQYGFVYNYAEPYFNFGFFSAFGGYVFGRNRSGYNPQDLGLDSAGSAQALSFIKDLRYRYNLIPKDQEVNYDFAHNAFLQGRAAMIINGPWAIGDYRKAGIDVGVAAVPTPPGATNPWSPFVGVQGVAVMAASDSKAQAIGLARYLASPDTQLALHRASGRIPVSKDVLAQLQADTVLQGFAAAIERGQPMPNLLEMGQVWDRWRNALELSQASANSNPVGLLAAAARDVRLAIPPPPVAAGAGSFLVQLNNSLNGLVYGLYMMIVFLLVGGWLSLRIRFLQLTRFNVAMRETLGAIRERAMGFGGQITPFQAALVAMSATVGTGHVAGVATAILVGGPGAVLWMWLGYLLGAATKFAEATLAVHFRRQFDDGTVAGGAMYYIARGLGPRWRWLAILFAIFAAAAAFGGGNMAQATALGSALQSAFNFPPAITGLVLMVLILFILGGGIVRVARATTVLVPLKLVLVLLGLIPLMVIYIGQLPGVFTLIINSALSVGAAAGGLLGYSLAQMITAGLGRGIFANEAGLGSAAFAHAQAQVDHPVRQGFWGLAEMLVSFIVTSLTALVFLSSGLWLQGDRAAPLLVQMFSEHPLYSSFDGGGLMLAITLAVLALGTMLAWGFYGEEAATYLFGEGIRWPFRLTFAVVAFVGPLGGFEFFLSVTDTLNGLMSIPNLLVLVLLSGLVAALVRGFFQGDPWRPPQD